MYLFDFVVVYPHDWWELISKTKQGLLELHGKQHDAINHRNPPVILSRVYTTVRVSEAKANHVDI